MDVTEQTGSPDSLVLCTFGKATKPEVMLSLTVLPNFTWQLTYHNKALNPSTSSFLADVPSVFTTVSDVVELLQMLNSCHVCVGNADIKLSRSIFMNATG